MALLTRKVLAFSKKEGFCSNRSTSEKRGKSSLFETRPIPAPQSNALPGCTKANGPCNATRAQMRVSQTTVSHPLAAQVFLHTVQVSPLSSIASPARHMILRRWEHRLCTVLKATIPPESVYCKLGYQTLTVRTGAAIHPVLLKGLYHAL